ncbi:MAG: hypothetical protein JXB88_04635 [Spirochaetales bacterium]|nr:hypothetical protein [Spirochaetales bacterium]
MNRTHVLFLCIILLPVWVCYAENINHHFELSVIRKKNPDAVYMTITPEQDKQIKGLSEEKPFIIVESPDVVFENKGILIQTEYITEPVQKVFTFPFRPAEPGTDLTQLNVHLTMTYVPCLISKGVCLFPETVERDYLLKVTSQVILPEIITTWILAAFLLLAVISLVFYIRIKKDIFFTILFIFIFAGILFYTFIHIDGNGISQADLSRDIARTLCLSCIGIESRVEVIPVDRAKTKVYAGLGEPVLITVFSASWCGTCPFAKEYVKELCSIYPQTLSYEVIEIHEPAGKEKYVYYKTLYTFKEPLPLPAIVVSVNMNGVIYGTNNLEENLIQLITGGADGQE